ncbi:amidohydrolase family protein [Sinimarinibacterium flocculans]|uniref:Putative amidohydrolase YtcJ n=1 Tax=Sinimarinibacterium flocculans TaxID=985250 RepID=A0A318EFP4_9GAMM|nr:amidohydrolase family protein [Sinimarinibacterium flocculans]PXV70494.1 putative amidohydrolase YtcJ [Sinimarinibacterium flocculans]
MLIHDAEIGGRRLDVRLFDARIEEIGEALAVRADEQVIDADGAALLPGLHDHHIHLRALAAARASVRCGPPQVRDRAALAQALRAADARLEADAWLRGTAYHESVAGELDRDVLDALLPQRPLRIQHRSGRLWVFNSAAISRLEPDAAAPLDLRRGHLLDADDWLRARLRTQPPSLHAISRELAAYGVTGVTDTTHHNGPEALDAFATAQARGELLQRVRVMGDARLDGETGRVGVQCGEHKFHLHEHALPALDALIDAIRRSHDHGRGCAFHCVTRTELVFALAALRVAGVRAGDRIEHAAVSPPELVADIAELGLTVVTQPGLVAERGDDYLRDVEAGEQPWLYRLRGFVDAGVGLALSTDAPFTDPNPWTAIAAAVTRRTAAGAVLGAEEALSPAQALAGFLTTAARPGAGARGVVPGACADLCLLDRGLAQALTRPGEVRVRLTLVAGGVVFEHHALTGDC